MLDRVLGVFAAVMLFVLMLITIVDVAGRDLLNAPLPGGFEVTELVLAALIFSALPIVTWRDEHVVIDLLDALTPRALVRPRDVIVGLVSAVVLALLARQLWLLGWKLVGYEEVTEYLHLPLAPIVFLMSVMSAVAALAALVRAVRGGAHGTAKSS